MNIETQCKCQETRDRNGNLTAVLLAIGLFLVGECLQSFPFVTCWARVIDYSSMHF